MSRKRRTILASIALAALGIAGVLGSAVAASPRRALLSWLAAGGFGLSTALGALLLVMIFHVTNARWPLALRPFLMAVVGTLPILCLFFVPVVLGLHEIYPWAHAPHELPEVGEELASALAHQRAWNQPAFFLVRALIYVAVWMAVALALGSASAAYDRDPTPERAARQRSISAVGIIAVAFTLTFAAFDWLMSVEPGWVSNLYGIYVFAGGLSAAISLVVIAAWRARRIERLPEAVGAPHFLALGRLLLMSVVLWSYVAFFQLMLVWIADLPREASFFLARSRGSYVAVDVLLVLGRFALPLLALLSRPLKGSGTALSMVGGWLLLMHAVDLAWLVLPSDGARLHVLDVAPFLAVAGFATAFATWRFDAAGEPVTAATLTERASVDPALADSLRYRSS